MSELRKKLEVIEARFAEDIDHWYLEAKQYLKGCGPHWLGRKKELIKTNLFYLGEYVEEVKTGKKSNNKSKLVDEIEIWTFEELTKYVEELENRIYKLESETEERHENE